MSPAPVVYRSSTHSPLPINAWTAHPSLPSATVDIGLARIASPHIEIPLLHPLHPYSPFPKSVNPAPAIALPAFEDLRDLPIDDVETRSVHPSTTEVAEDREAIVVSKATNAVDRL